MAGGGAEWGRELDSTPTWAVASVCSVIIVVSVALEAVLHRLRHWFTESNKKAMVEALEKVKAELMTLGFISLMLTFGQTYIAKICIPEKIADTMLPCGPMEKDEEDDGGHQRRLLWTESSISSSLKRRFLASAVTSSCPSGKVPLISLNGIHQLHVFIFFLAVFHVLYSATTMALGRAKIRRWKEWEKEAQSLEYEYSNDPSRFRLAHETSFVRRHTSFCNSIRIMFYIISFFRQFFRSVHKSDYLAMRNGFISKYIKRSLEDDFKVVVGISSILWVSVVLLLLLNVKGWETMFWASFIPLILALAVGTKLQAIITDMALEVISRHVVIQGVPLVTLCDSHFWFNRPGLVLLLIHFTLFQNSFQIIYFLWIWYTFGLNSCFHKNKKFIIARICLGVGVQFLCSYVTLPLYALVSQMGSQMKNSIFDEQTSQTLKKWHQAVKKKHIKSSLTSQLTSPSATPGSSPVHLLHRFKTIGHSLPAMVLYGRHQFSDNDMSDTETEMLPSTALADAHSDVESGAIEKQHQDLHEHQEGGQKDDFSFVKLTAQAE